MFWRLLFLSLLCLSSGCSHSGLPPITASHGHLSLAMDAYLSDPRSYEKRIAQGSNLGQFSPFNAHEEGPSLELERDQAAGAFEEAVHVLKGEPHQEDLHRALRDLQAACDADHEKACQFLEAEYQRPRFQSGEMLHPRMLPGPRKRVRGNQYVVIVIECLLATDGRMHDCQIIEQGPESFTSDVLIQLSSHRYKPWMLAGHPLGQPYGLTFNFISGRQGSIQLSEKQTLEWARLRVGWAPKSASAWSNLAAQLAIHTPDAPDYLTALAQAHALAPRYWWTATEVAWRLSQVGQHAAALMTLRPVLRRSTMGKHPNPYVLETAAAAQFGLKQCPEALAQQRKAVEMLPADWLAPEKERFQRKLQDYQSACAAPPSATR
ncbi:hypothetical protein D7W82_22695 [Corallococcus sp. CA049B]|uniref:hypothetical protein n=1 Tax=Corallococcus sp. CA049B TaxID=2316730 RepID=UPI000EA3F811|nr:hypothetical protein [Corallococcus sp. CA049B]RKG84312.1 hypothetical protein D7W82_22695 [Corallococcus sp. CA049B]